MIRRLTGRDATSAAQLGRETGVWQPTLSRWLQEARTLPDVAKPKASSRSIDEKVRILAAAAPLTGDELAAMLEREGVHLAEYQQWRKALGQGPAPAPSPSPSPSRRIRQLEREVARKDKALAEAAALIILKKKADLIWGDGDDATDEKNEK